MRKAWQRRDTLDLEVQAVIAKCLIVANSVVSTRKSEVREATVVLRGAIHDANAMTVLMAVKGLAIIGEDQDVEEIAEVPWRTRGSLNSIVRTLGLRVARAI